MNAKLIVEGEEFDVEILDPKLQNLIAPKPTKEKAIKILQSCGIFDAKGQLVDAYKDILIYKEPVGKKTGYEKVNYPCQETPIYFDFDGEVEVGVMPDLEAYDAANYYSDKTVAENNARADKLMRRLRRFAVEHRKTDIDYSEGVYEICYDVDSKKVRVNSVSVYHYFGTIPFDTQKAAEYALAEFRDELLWYFTEYKDSL